MRRYTAAEARALREAASDPTTSTADHYRANMELRDAAGDLAATVESLEAELAEARLCLLAEARDPAGAVGLHPGWVHRAAGWCLLTQAGETPVAMLRRNRPALGEGSSDLSWTPEPPFGWRSMPWVSGMREAMRWVESQVLP